MEITLIIYGMSFLILLLVYLYSKIFQKDLESSSSFKDEPWYLWVVIVLFAPLVVLLIPYIIVQGYFEDKKRKKRDEEWEAKKLAEEEKRNAAFCNFKNAMQTGYSCLTNDFVQVAQSLFSSARAKGYSQILSHLNMFSLPKGYRLEVIECEDRGIGDSSSLIICADGVKDSDLWRYMQVEDSFMGAWQAYLLGSLWHVLPVFWHGGYDTRSYIFSKSDFSKINFIEEKDGREIMAKLLLEDYYITPEIYFYNDKYYITCCYWSDWGGLIRECVEITIQDGKVLDSFIFDETPILEYDCGIMF